MWSSGTFSLRDVAFRTANSYGIRLLRVPVALPQATSNHDSERLAPLPLKGLCKLMMTRGHPAARGPDNEVVLKAMELETALGYVYSHSSHASNNMQAIKNQGSAKSATKTANSPSLREQPMPCRLL